MTYYNDTLSGKRLKLCYDLAPPRIRQYLNEEIKFVHDRIKIGHRVLELGCGYGRVLEEMPSRGGLLIGVDLSLKSLRYGKYNFLKSHHIFLIQMDAGKLGFHDYQFDIVFCIQNGLSALGIEPKLLIEEALRVTKPKGKLILSSYSDKIWGDRLRWFQIQANHNLIGEIDFNLTKEGVIICRDGFKATTFNPDQYEQLLIDFDNNYEIYEINESSIICEIEA